MLTKLKRYVSDSPEVPVHWEKKLDDNGEVYYIDTEVGEWYRVNGKQHTRVDTNEKLNIISAESRREFNEQKQYIDELDTLRQKVKQLETALDAEKAKGIEDNQEIEAVQRHNAVLQKELDSVQTNWNASRLEMEAMIKEIDQSRLENRKLLNEIIELRGAKRCVMPVAAHGPVGNCVSCTETMRSRHPTKKRMVLSSRNSSD